MLWGERETRVNREKFVKQANKKSGQMYPFCLPLALPRQHFIVIFASVGGKKGNTASIVLPGRHFWLLGQNDDAFEGRQTHHILCMSCEPKVETVSINASILGYSSTIWLLLVRHR